MKKVSLYIVMAIMTMIATVACTDDNVSDLRLSGNCDVTEFAVDNYEGSIDRAAKTITVRVPEVYGCRRKAEPHCAESVACEQW